MLEELRRFNTIGDPVGISYFAQIVLASDKVQRSSIQKLCGLQSNMRLNVRVAITYFKYLGLITEEDIFLAKTDSGNKLIHSKNFSYEFCSLCIEKIIRDGLLDLCAVHYSRGDNLYYIEPFGFPVSAALFRNILIQYNAIKENPSRLIIAEKFEPIFAEYQKKSKLKTSLQKLKEQLEQQEIQGEAAELFVIRYEKKRITNYDKKKLIKRISIIDVTAGYDVISYNNDCSEEYDRFIEVKSYFGNPHFYWSKNEIDTAKLYGNKYFIYLVDLSRVSDEKYIPEIINDPANTVIKSEKWIMSSTSFLVMPTV